RNVMLVIGVAGPVPLRLVPTPRRRRQLTGALVGQFCPVGVMVVFAPVILDGGVPVRRVHRWVRAKALAFEISDDLGEGRVDVLRSVLPARAPLHDVTPHLLSGTGPSTRSDWRPRVAIVARTCRCWRSHHVRNPALFL